MSKLREQGIQISLSTIATLIPVLGVLWFFAQPVLVSAIAADLDDMIEQKQAPIQSAFKALLVSESTKIKRRAAKLEFVRDHHPEEWTEDYADELAELKIELDALAEAMEELE
jgi:hypothetical protein